MEAIASLFGGPAVFNGIAQNSASDDRAQGGGAVNAAYRHEFFAVNPDVLFVLAEPVHHRFKHPLDGVETAVDF